MPIVRPNHKIGDTTVQNDNKTRRRATPDNAERGFNLGNPTVLKKIIKLILMIKIVLVQEMDILQLLDLLILD